MMHDLAIYRGTLSHHRYSPVDHALRYSVFQVWLNVKRPELVDRISRWWSSNRPNLVRYKRDNYLPGDADLYQEIVSTVHQHTGKNFSGDAYLLANLSYWGYCYNPASFYCCFEEQRLCYFICEIHNTPWGERFTYVHDVSNDVGKTGFNEAIFNKAFHVSPFMPMELVYKWRYRIHDDKILITMNLLQDEDVIFNSTLNLRGQPLSTNIASSIPFRYPLMCFKVLGGIYWNAFKLWFKGVAFHSHPDKKSKTP